METELCCKFPYISARITLICIGSITRQTWSVGCLTSFIPLVKSGKVRRVGVSNHNLAQIKRAEEILSGEGVHVSAVQNHYSLLYRSSEKACILDYCKENGIDFWAYMVL